MEGEREKERKRNRESPTVLPLVYFLLDCLLTPLKCRLLERYEKFVVHRGRTSPIAVGIGGEDGERDREREGERGIGAERVANIAERERERERERW